MSQSQTEAKPRHQEEEKKDKNIHAQKKQTNEREAQIPAPSSQRDIRMLNQTEKRGEIAREDIKTFLKSSLNICIFKMHFNLCFARRCKEKQNVLT